MMTPNGTRLLMLACATPSQERLIGAAATRAGWRILKANDAEGAVALLGTHEGMVLDAAIIASGEDTQSLVADIHERRPTLSILLLCDSHIQGLAALRAGAQDYLLGTVTPERVIQALTTTVVRDTNGELRPLSEKIVTPLSFDELVGAAPTFRAALAKAAKAARGRIPILIEGESGVGKRTIAQAVHLAGPRARKPFIDFDCASHPVALLESRLFGHEEGAFAGAFARHIGACEAADGGTLLIDHIHLLPAPAQVQLLRLIGKGENLSLGASAAKPVDLRLIVATDAPLHKAMTKGAFREDLYYKLNPVHCIVPPLRERLGDLPALVRHVLAQLAKTSDSRAFDVRSVGITDSALDLLGRYDWPGNVRQLQSVLLRAMLGCEGAALTAADFPHIATQTGRPVALPPILNNTIAGGVTLFTPDGHMRPLEAIEADVIRLAIGHYRGRMSEVARRLGIGRSTLYRKLVELGISDAAA